jgi:hypothetical protein
MALVIGGAAVRLVGRREKGAIRMICVGHLDVGE